MYKQQIIQIFILSLNESDSTDLVLRQTSLKGIHEMVLMKQFLKGDEVNLVINHLTRQLMAEDKQLGQQALTTLGVITKLYPIPLAQITFPVLLKELPCSENIITVSATYRHALNAIQLLAVSPAVFKIVINPLLKKLDYACGTIGKKEDFIYSVKTHTDNYLGQENISYAHDVASTILLIYKEASVKDPEILTIGQKLLLPSLLLKCIPAGMGVPGSWYLDDSLIETFAMVVAITTRLSSPR